MEGFKQRNERTTPVSGWRTDQKAARGDVENQLWTTTDQARCFITAWFRVKKYRDERGGEDGGIFRRKTSTGPNSELYMVLRPSTGQNPIWECKKYTYTILRPILEV